MMELLVPSTQNKIIAAIVENYFSIPQITKEDHQRSLTNRFTIIVEFNRRDDPFTVGISCEVRVLNAHSVYN